jgi:choline dehydrogenase-like flavoprotein
MNYESEVPFDVCIIGSGPAGSILGKILAGIRVRTVIVESGPDPGRKYSDSQFKGLEVYRCSGSIKYPVEASRSRALGGTTNIWTGRCPRLHPLDFEKNGYTPRDAQWPITYGELEPFYEQAERTLRVRGGALSIYSPPRKMDLPLPPDLDITALKDMMRGIGITVDHSPTSTANKRNSLSDLLKEFMKGKGCLKVAEDILPDFSASPYGVLFSGLTVTRIVPESYRSISWVEAKTLDGRTRIIRARIFVVACGGIESPRLLLLSRSKYFPNGVGNNNGLVGRYFMEHPRITYHGKLRHKWGAISHPYKVARSYQFHEKFKREGLGSVRLGFRQSWIFPDDLKDLSYPNVLQKLGTLAGRVIRPCLMVTAAFEMLPSMINRVTLASDLRDILGSPAADLSLNFSLEDHRTMDRVRMLIREIYEKLGVEETEESEISWLHHHIGTCRMGDNPRTSVVDRNLRVHDCSNLYVIGSSVFVTGGASPPTLTIAALSHRLAGHLISKLKG